MAMEVFVFQVEALQFSKFHENVDKLHKGNFSRGLSDHDIQGQKLVKLMEKMA